MSGTGDNELTKEQKTQISEYAIYNARDVAAVKEFIVQNDPKGFAAYVASARDASGNSRPLHLEGMEVQGVNIGASPNSPDKIMGKAHELEGKWDFSRCIMHGVKLHDLEFQEAHLPNSFTTAELGVGESKDFERYPAVLENVTIARGSIKNLEGVVITGDHGLSIGASDSVFDLRDANLQNLKFKGAHARIDILGDVDVAGAQRGGEATYKGEEILDYNTNIAELEAKVKAAPGGTKEWQEARAAVQQAKEENFKLETADRTELGQWQKRAPALLAEFSKDNNLPVIDPVQNMNSISRDQLAAIRHVLAEDDLASVHLAGHFLSKHGPAPEERRDLGNYTYAGNAPKAPSGPLGAGDSDDSCSKPSSAYGGADKGGRKL